MARPTSRSAPPRAGGACTPAGDTGGHGGRGSGRAARVARHDREAAHMTATDTTRPVLSDEEVVRLLALLHGCDSVELKLTIPESAQRSAIRALAMDPLDAQIRQVFFFDTPDLALNTAGVVVRARRVQRKGDDATVKLRPVVPEQLPAGLRGDPDFVVEVDAMPGGFVCSGTLKSVVRPGLVPEVVAGERPIRKLFSKAQRAFF